MRDQKDLKEGKVRNEDLDSGDEEEKKLESAYLDPTLAV
jgi:hypothetical protein